MTLPWKNFPSVDVKDIEVSNTCGQVIHEAGSTMFCRKYYREVSFKRRIRVWKKIFHFQKKIMWNQNYCDVIPADVTSHVVVSIWTTFWREFSVNLLKINNSNRLGKLWGHGYTFCTLFFISFYYCNIVDITIININYHFQLSNKALYL